MYSTAPAKASNVKTRSLGGCSTCRRAHIKCDETRPTCLACDRLGIQCGGYETRITFTFELCGNKLGQQDKQSEVPADGVRFRRPLFTEVYRQKMSQSLVSSVPPNVAHDLLSLLDAEGTQFENGESGSLEVIKGPFSIFTVGPLVATKSPSTSPETSIIPDQSTYDGETDPLLPYFPELQMVFSQGYLDGIFNSALSDSLNNEALSPGDLPSPHLLLDAANTSPYVPTHTNYLDTSQNISFLGPGLSFPSSQAPADAPALLYHYQNSVVPLLSPLRYHKTPWNVLFIPSAMNTLAALTMGQTPSNASLCVFQALLSISAFHFTASTSEQQQQHWRPRANYYIGLAQQSLERALNEQGSIPKRNKYKETLMGLLSMITASVFGGYWKQTRCYLLDADTLIRQHGLTKPHKSRKVRLLHHCYTYVRIIHESTLIPTLHPEDNANSSALSGKDKEESPLRARKWDGRLDQRLLINKSSLIGENDLLLAIPGRWEPTLYPSIYGIPESFLVLLSETTRLANERHTLQNLPSESNLTWPQYLLRAKVLEKCICNWEATVVNYPQEWSSSVPMTLIDTNRSLISQMMLALHQALLIYFYRRIHDIDPMILEDRVEKTLQLLLKCEELDQDTGQCAAPFAWMGFVVACEALNREVQEKFSSWFRRCSRRSGIMTFDVAHQLAEQIWKQRREVDDVGISWLKLVNARGSRLCFT